MKCSVGENEQGKGLLLVGILLVLLLASRWISVFILDYQWWKELQQLPTWQTMLAYNVLPYLGAAAIAFFAFWIAHARGMRQGGTRLGEHMTYAKLATLAMLALAVIVALISLDAWTIVSFYGSHKAGLSASSWRDPIFGNPLPFYLFTLPFYQQLLGLLLAITFLTSAVYWAAARGWSVAREATNWREEGFQLDLKTLRLTGGLEPLLLRILVAIFLVAMAARAYLSRYDFMLDDHGFLVGIDYVAHNVTDSSLVGFHDCLSWRSATCACRPMEVRGGCRRPIPAESCGAAGGFRSIR